MTSAWLELLASAPPSRISRASPCSTHERTARRHTVHSRSHSTWSTVPEKWHAAKSSGRRAASPSKRERDSRRRESVARAAYRACVRRERRSVMIARARANRASERVRAEREHCEPARASGRPYHEPVGSCRDSSVASAPIAVDSATPSRPPPSIVCAPANPSRHAASPSGPNASIAHPKASPSPRTGAASHRSASASGRTGPRRAVRTRCTPERLPVIRERLPCHP